MVVLMSLLGILFVCSFSSILSAGLLIFLSLISLVVMYWNVVSMVPLYLFSLFMMGGLFVLIGFVMMADTHDIDQMNTGEEMVDLAFGLVMIIFWLNWEGKYFFEGMDLIYQSDGVMKKGSWDCSFFFSGTFLFLVFFLLIFLFVIYLMMKGLSGEGGFMKYLE